MAQPNKKIITYFAAWGIYGKKYFVKDLPLDDLTGCCYAFFNIARTDKGFEVVAGDSWADFEKRFTTADEGVLPLDSWSDSATFHGNFGQFKKRIEEQKKQGKRPLHLELSIGGWTWSKHFSPAVAPQNQEVFANSIIAILQKYPIFSGISLDWEYLSGDGVNYGNAGNEVSKDDPKNFESFLKLFKRKCADAKLPCTISICVSPAPEKVSFSFNGIHPLLDEIHIMTYDFHSPAWGETTMAEHCNPRKSPHGKYSAEEAADFYLSLGIPSTKLFIGGALYSRGGSGTVALGSAVSGNSTDTDPVGGEAGIVSYKNLPMAGATEMQDPISKGGFSVDPVKRIVNTYDTVASMMEKCKIIREKNLGGIILWEASGDTPVSNQRSLIKTLSRQLLNNPTPAPTPTPTPTPTPNPPAQDLKKEMLDKGYLLLPLPRKLQDFKRARLEVGIVSDKNTYDLTILRQSFT